MAWILTVQQVKIHVDFKNYGKGINPGCTRKHLCGSQHKKHSIEEKQQTKAKG